MGAIRKVSTGSTRELEPQHVIGRTLPPMCSQTIDDPRVSGIHALIRWTGRIWELRDLNSRNGTYLDGARIEPNVALCLREGSRIGYGTPGEEWLVVNDAPPDVMAVPLDGGAPVRSDGELLALPAADDPRATIYRTMAGQWVLESADDAQLPLANLQVFEAAGHLWRFCYAEVNTTTMAASDGPALSEILVANLHLDFAVSSDEEHVEIRMTCGSRVVDLGDRTHNYTLLTLARRRLKDVAAGFAETSCGWVEVETLARGPSMNAPRINLDVYRLRDQFLRAGVLDAPKIVERRMRPRQLRIGTGNISIRTL